MVAIIQRYLPVPLLTSSALSGTFSLGRTCCVPLPLGEVERERGLRARGGYRFGGSGVILRRTEFGGLVSCLTTQEDSLG